MKIDGHQHFWRLARGDYGWITEDLTALYRDFMPNDLTPLLQRAGIDGTILVQAAPTIAETEFLLTIADAHPFIKGVVGWVDFEANTARSQIDQLAQHPKLLGLRPMIQDIPDPDWIMHGSFDPIFETMMKHKLAFDALVLPKHLKTLRLLIERHPDLCVVIDHASKPEISAARFKDWATDMTSLATGTNAFCKLSGLVTEAKPGWSTDDLRPYVDHLLNQFGVDRVIWGSDWPVCTLSATYAEWVGATELLLAGLSDNERACIMGKNAQRAYGFAI